MSTETAEGLDSWGRDFDAGWLSHLEATGETDFKQYRYVKNAEEPAGPGLEVSRSRLLFVTTSGAFVDGEHAPFDASNPRGDYSVRSFDLSTPLERIRFAHEHYDHKFADADKQAVLPLRHLEALAASGEIGEVASTVVSFSGYMPDIRRVIDETIPAVVDVARREEAHGALLVPV